MKISIRNLKALIKESSFDRVKINSKSINDVEIRALDALKLKLCEISNTSLANHVSLDHLWRNTAPGVNLNAFWMTHQNQLIISVTCIDENHMMTNDSRFDIRVLYDTGSPEISIFYGAGSMYSVKRTSKGVNFSRRSDIARGAKPMFDDLVNHIEEWAQPQNKDDGSWWADKETYELIRPLFDGEDYRYPPTENVIAYDPTTGEELS